MCGIFKHIFIFALTVNISYIYFYLKYSMNTKLNCLLMKSRWVLRRNKQSTMIKLKVNHMSLMSGKKKLSLNHLIFVEYCKTHGWWLRSNFPIPFILIKNCRCDLFIFFASLHFALLDLNAELPNKGVRRTFLFHFIQQWPILYKYYYT